MSRDIVSTCLSPPSVKERMNETGYRFEPKHDNIINANSISITDAGEMAKTEEDATTAGSIAAAGKAAPHPNQPAGISAGVEAVEPTAMINTGTTSSTHKTNTARSRKLVLTFPQRLHDVLSRTEAQSAVVWTTDGLHFLIISPRQFVSSVLPKYFKQTKFASFTRKLNRWGFRRISSGPNVGAYCNKLFQRDNPSLSLQMRCLDAVAKYSTNESETQQVLPASTQLPGIGSLFHMQPFAQASGMQPILPLMTAQGAMAGASHMQLAQRTNGTTVSDMIQPHQEITALNMTAQQLYAQNLNLHASIDRQHQMLMQMGVRREELLTGNNQAGTAQHVQTSQDHSGTNFFTRQMHQAHVQQHHQPMQSNSMLIGNQHEQQIPFPAGSQQALALSFSTNAYHNPQMMTNAVASAGQNQLIHAAQSQADSSLLCGAYGTLSEEGKISQFSPVPLAPRPLHIHTDQNRKPGPSNAKSA